MRSLNYRVHAHPDATPIYQLTDRLHDGHTARVSVDGIAGTVASWLAEFGVLSPLAEDLEQTVREGHWAAAHAIADRLSVDVTIAV
ncbi:Putative uncharacterized protein [Mycolicibacterium vanbaalenii]|uniref:Uncharacterized protein n=1 Tax=Mycolicibacterium vanbaalenii TaxID=110539 RepID=A0A5S9R5Q0_MYCVN|nr:hypothetical protein [Mycolicibacterium vanbaalenii]CAA0128633.1 Putative uncharacterized protein [Mycolicibacterium vanbaalenii]